MSDGVRPENSILGLISGWKRTLERRDKTMKNAILGIRQDYIPVTTDGIMQELSSEEQADLNAFVVYKDGGIVYSTSSIQLRKMTVTREQADICSYYSITKDITDEGRLNEKQRLLLLRYAYHL